MRTHVSVLMVSGLLFATMMLFSACSGDSGGSGRQSCTQPQDCGEGGRVNWICSLEGKCYSIEEYCDSDEQCNGACVEHVCEGGKIDTGVDGDDEPVDGDPEECMYACCDDMDCFGAYVCDLNTHTCIPGQSDNDCEVDSDCDTGKQCANGQCVDIPQTTCQPNSQSCCSLLEYDYPACEALGDLAMEARLTCAADGRSWEIEMCPAFESCIYETQTTVTCFPNNRCETDDDCESPKVCGENDDGNLRCQQP